MISPDLSCQSISSMSDRIDLVIYGYLNQHYTFRAATLYICSCIPTGKVSSYGKIARILGEPKQARQVGYILRTMDKQELELLEIDHIPWWRVIRSDGTLPLPSHHPNGYLQRQYLKDEGVVIVDDRISMKTYSWSLD